MGSNNPPLPPSRPWGARSRGPCAPGARSRGPCTFKGPCAPGVEYLYRGSCTQAHVQGSMCARSGVPLQGELHSGARSRGPCAPGVEYLHRGSCTQRYPLCWGKGASWLEWGPLCWVPPSTALPLISMNSVKLCCHLHCRPMTVVSSKLNACPTSQPRRACLSGLQASLPRTARIFVCVWCMSS